MDNDQYSQEAKNQDVNNLIQELIKKLTACKPEERGELARWYAIAKTDAQKMHGYWQKEVMGGAA